MVKSMLGVLSVAALLAGVYCLQENYRAGRQGEWDRENESNIVLTGSLASFGRSLTPSAVQPWLHFSVIVFILASHEYQRLRHRGWLKRMDSGLITPSDYTIVLENVPKDADLREIKSIVEKSGRPDGVPCTVVRMTLAYDLRQFTAAVAELHKAQIKLSNLKRKLMQEGEKTRKFTCCTRESTLQSCESSVSSLLSTVHLLELSVKSHFSGVLFLSFIQDEGTVYSEAKISALTLKSAFPSPSCCSPGIRIARAPEPSDICWGNLGASQATRVARKVATWGVTAVVLGACVVGILFSRLWRDNVAGKYAEADQPWICETILIYTLRFLPAMIVVVTNLVLNVVVRRFTLLEKHISETQYNASVASKLTIAMFLNTAVITMLVHYDDWYGANGLVVEAYNILIANAIVQPLFYLCGPKLILRKIRQKVALRKGEKCALSQREANLLFEGPPVDMPQRYAGFLKTYLLTVFYAPVLPSALLVCVFAVAIEYWVDKYMLLRVHARPARLGSALDSSMQGFVTVGCVLYSASSLYFFYQYGGGRWVAGVSGVVLSLAALCVPTGWIAKVVGAAKMREMEVEKLSESDKTYEEAVLDFLDDYDRANPVTAQESTRSWVELVKAKRGEQAARHASSLLTRELSRLQESSSLFEQVLRQEVRRQVFVRHVKQLWPLGISVK